MMERTTIFVFWLVFVGLAISSGVVIAANPAQAEKKMVATSNTRFASDLYSRLRSGEEGNIFFSPYSISSVMAMIHGGARGNTERQIAGVLHFELDQDRLHRAFGELTQAILRQGQSSGYQLRIANGLWIQKGLPVLESYSDLLRKHYLAEARQLDFARQAEAARIAINSWTEKQTAGRIKDLLPPGIPDQNARLVLTNAIYFKGNWASKFSNEETVDAPFKLLNGQEITVPMMHQTGQFNFMAGPGFRGLELPYVGEKLSIIVLLPDKDDGLGELEKSLNADNLATWIKQFNKQEVRLGLPRFRINQKLGLTDTLRAMGVIDAFSPSEADFSGIDGKRDLFLSDVIHEAFVEVNEEGSEAAGASAAIANMATSVQQSQEFVADHPFILVIKDSQSNSILFMGRVTNPIK